MTTNSNTDPKTLLVQIQQKTITLYYMLNFLIQLSGDGKNSASITLDNTGVDGFREMLRLLADVSFSASEHALCVEDLLNRSECHG